MILDVNVLLGRWAFRRLPAEDAVTLREALSRAGIVKALVGSLDAVLYRDPAEGNERLYRAIRSARDFFTPAATLDPTYAGWTRELERARSEGCVAVRTYPAYQGWRLEETRVAEFFKACAEQRLPVVLTAAMEDARQRHGLDRPEDWRGAELRNLIERERDLRVLVANARADRIRTIALSLSDADRRRVGFDVSAVWGPFVDDLAACAREIGAGRFVFGSHAALKTPESAVWRVRHADLTDDEKTGIFREHARDLIPGFG